MSERSATTDLAPAQRRPVRQLVAASIGNAVEWYDWYLYTAPGSLTMQNPAT